MVFPFSGPFRFNDVIPCVYVVEKLPYIVIIIIKSLSLGYSATLSMCSYVVVLLKVSVSSGPPFPPSLPEASSVFTQLRPFPRLGYHRARLHAFVRLVFPSREVFAAFSARGTAAVRTGSDVTLKQFLAFPPPSYKLSRSSS